MTDRKTLQMRARELRNNMTREERHLWYDFLKDHSSRILRQYPIEHYILDFYCPKLRLAVELDGGQHYEEEHHIYDTKRSKELAARGILILRIPNNAIWDNFSGVCEWLNLQIEERTKIIQLQSERSGGDCFGSLPQKGAVGEAD